MNSPSDCHLSLKHVRGETYQFRPGFQYKVVADRSEAVCRVEQGSIRRRAVGEVKEIYLSLRPAPRLAGFGRQFRALLVTGRRLRLMSYRHGSAIHGFSRVLATFLSLSLFSLSSEPQNLTFFCHNECQIAFPTSFLKAVCRHSL